VRGLLRFLAFFGLVAAVLVLVVLPLALSPILTQAVRDMGFRSDTLEVSVAAFDPTLLLGRSRRVSLIATGVDASPAEIGSLNIALGNASYFDQTFETVDGEMADIAIRVDGGAARITTVTLAGRADAADAVATLSPADTESLVQLAARRAGLTLDAVTVSATGLTVRAAGIEATAQISVRGGALLLDPGVGGAIVLLQPQPSDPWRLNEAWISAEGLNVRGVVDVAALVTLVTGGTIGVPDENEDPPE
jgi:hypothetical protein